MENIKRRKICTSGRKAYLPRACKTSNNPVLKVELLPNEILMNIFSHLNINDLYKCAQVSKKFRQISHDKSFWKCVNLYNQRVSCEFIAQIIKLGTEYLNLHGATLSEEDNADLPRKNDLKYLNLAESSMEDTFLVKLLRSSKSLEKLSLTGVNQKHFYEGNEIVYHDQPVYNLVNNHSAHMLEYATSWYLECLLPNAKMLTTLDLSRKQKADCSIHFESIKEIIIVCDELREANFEWQEGIEDDLDFFANNLSTKIEKLNISNINILDEHMVKLLKRCKNITELDLYCCGLQQHSSQQRTLTAISENLSQSLVKLQLPDHSFIYPGFLNSLPKLKNLWHQKGTWNFDLICGFPQISINEGNAQIANCAREYFEPKFGFWELKCAAADFPKIK